jgi:hypothetical protein
VARRRIQDDPSQALHDYDEKYLECRFGHAWQTLGYHRTDGSNDVTRQQACPRCGTTVHDIWTAAGGRVTRRYYNRPSGYSLSGFGHIPGDFFRAEMLSRVKVYSSEDAMLRAMMKRQAS